MSEVSEDTEVSAPDVPALPSDSREAAPSEQVAWLKREITPRRFFTVLLATSLLVTGLSVFWVYLQGRPQWDIVIRGCLRHENAASLANVTVDAFFPGLGRWVAADGREFGTRKKANQGKRSRYRISKAASKSNIVWHDDGSFELHVSLLSRQAPNRCRLIYRCKSQKPLRSSVFALKGLYPGDRHLTGDAPELSLDQSPSEILSGDVAP